LFSGDDSVFVPTHAASNQGGFGTLNVQSEATRIGQFSGMAPSTLAR
jgi:hypothetical protein